MNQTDFEFEIEIPMNTLAVGAMNRYMEQFKRQIAKAAGITDQNFDDVRGPVFVKSNVAVVEPVKKKRASAAEPKVAKEKPLIKLPYDEVNHQDRCQALVVNGGLYTQCANDKVTAGEFCKTCAKHVATLGAPKHGHINDRLACEPMDFVPPSGQQLKYYANVVGLGGPNPKVTLEQMREQFDKFGVVMRDWHTIRAPIKHKAAGKTTVKNQDDEESADNQIASLISQTLAETAAQTRQPTPEPLSPLFTPVKSNQATVDVAVVQDDIVVDYDDDDDDDADNDDLPEPDVLPGWLTNADEVENWILELCYKPDKTYDVNRLTNQVYIHSMTTEHVLVDNLWAYITVKDGDENIKFSKKAKRK